jgi:hypothetical protein
MTDSGDGRADRQSRSPSTEMIDSEEKLLANLATLQSPDVKVSRLDTLSGRRGAFKIKRETAETTNGGSGDLPNNVTSLAAAKTKASDDKR